jgi:hypothetical protein
METLEKESPRGIEWGINKQLTDIDYADDICILTHSSARSARKAINTKQRRKKERTYNKY